jgi:hypothetical protein
MSGTTAVQSPAGAMMGFFLMATVSTPALGPAQLPIKWIPGALAPGGKADHSSPSSADVNAWSYTSIPPYVFMAWYLIKQEVCLHAAVLSQAQGQLYLTIFTKFVLVCDSLTTLNRKRIT